jgi:hypothetical protein
LRQACLAGTDRTGAGATGRGPCDWVGAALVTHAPPADVKRSGLRFLLLSLFLGLSLVGVETRIGRALLAGDVRDGAVIRVDYINGELAVSYENPS